MKSFIICAILVSLAAVALGDKEQFQANVKECLAEAKVTEEEIKTFMQNGMKASDAKDNIKCHMKCLMEKQGTFKNGVFQDTVAAANLKKMPGLQDKAAEIDAALATCKSQKGANDCDTAFKISMCLKDQKATPQP